VLLRLMAKKHPAKVKRSHTAITSPWRDSVNPTDPAHRPRGDRQSLLLALEIINPDKHEWEALAEEISNVARLYNAQAAVAAAKLRGS
jgi:hypothetical protein